jgi:hypothetical protein
MRSFNQSALSHPVAYRASFPTQEDAMLPNIFVPSPEDLGFDRDYPRGMTVPLMVAMALSLATVIGIGIAVWSLFHA